MMQFLAAEQHPNRLEFRVWLDTAKAEKNGEPDKRYVRHYRFPDKPPDGWSGASLDGIALTDWAAYCTAEVKLLTAADLAQIEGTKATETLPVSGQTFN